MKTTLIKSIVAAAVFGAVATAGFAQAIVSFTGYTANTLARNDDGSTGSVSLGFSANFFGSTYSNAYVNNNGNLTFTQALETYTPSGLTTSAFPIIAPFWADVDTRSYGSPVTYGSGVFNGRLTFAANYIDVAPYQNLNLINNFQVLLVDRSDITTGDFDIVFNYGSISWETGDYSGGSNGLGGYSARVGYNSGTGSSFELAGSGVNGAFLSSNLSTSLEHHAFNSDVLGRYVFNVRGGNVVETPTTAVPEASTYGLMGGFALCGVAFLRRRFNRKT